MATWTFVRHGESRANAQRWLAGWADTPLTPEGENQARTTGEQLADQAWTRVLSSDLLRTMQTANALLGRRTVPITAARDLRERDLGRWQGRSIQDLATTGDGATLLRWDTPAPGGESLRDVALRGLAFLDGIDSDPRAATLIVTHGGFLRAVLGVVDQTPFERIGLYQPGNCAVIQREFAPGWAAAARARITTEAPLNDGD